MRFKGSCRRGRLSSLHAGIIATMTGLSGTSPWHGGTVVAQAGAFVNPCGTGAISGFRQNCFVAGAGPGALPEIRVLDPTQSPSPGQSSIVAYDPSFTGGVRVAMADLDGDGVADLITGAGPTGGPHVKVFDGATGALMHSFLAFSDMPNGIYVAAADVNDDGSADIIVGRGSGLPTVRVFDGRTQAMIREFLAYAPAFGGGVRVAGGDINADGYADIITGAGPGGGPHVQAFSGYDGSLLTEFFAYDPTFAGGVYVAAGDVDEDGFSDVVVGPGPGQSDPVVRVFSGKNGDEILAIPVRLGRLGASGYGVRVAAADLINAGRAEVVTALENDDDRLRVWRGTAFNDWVDVFFYSNAQAFVAAPVPMNRMFLDVPPPGSVQAQPFNLGGWALQESAVAGSGVEAIHVWAWPDTGAAPTFVGLAVLGAARPDVAALFGSRFSTAGFNLTVSGLAPGGYTIAAYVHSAVSSTFNDLRSVHISVQ